MTGFLRLWKKNVGQATSAAPLSSSSTFSRRRPPPPLPSPRGPARRPRLPARQARARRAGAAVASSSCRRAGSLRAVTPPTRRHCRNSSSGGRRRCQSSSSRMWVGLWFLYESILVSWLRRLILCYPLVYIYRSTGRERWGGRGWEVLLLSPQRSGRPGHRPDEGGRRGACACFSILAPCHLRYLHSYP